MKEAAVRALSLVSALSGAIAGLNSLHQAIAYSDIGSPLPSSARFILAPAGSFTMGRSEEDSLFPELSEPEQPHLVTLNEFEIQTTEVTQGQYYKVMGSNPSRFSNSERCPETFQKVGKVGLCPQHPVENVSYNELTAPDGFLARLNSAESDYIYRLPTEAEWEYAARAGTQTDYAFGDDWRQMEAYSVNPISYSDEGDELVRTAPVGSKLPNAWGLYDIHGNVGELTGDTYGNLQLFDNRSPYNLSNYSQYRELTSSIAPESRDHVAVRGSVSFLTDDYRIVPLYRRIFGVRALKDATLGFRLVRTRR